LGSKDVIFSGLPTNNTKSAAVPGHVNDKGHQHTVRKEVNQKIGKIRIPFVANQGQSDRRVRFYAPTFGGTVFVTEDGEIIYSLPRIEDRQIENELALKENVTEFNMKHAK
jgi:hypothetical protein